MTAGGAGVSIRPVTAADEKTIVAAFLAWAGEGSAWGPLPGPSRPAPAGTGVGARFAGIEAWLEPDWDALAAVPAWAFLIAEDERGDFAGFARGTAGDVTGKLLLALPEGGQVFEVTEVYVPPEKRGGGIGSRMLNELLAAAAAHGLHRATLVSASVNTDAMLRFYRRHGFTSWWVEFVRDAPPPPGEGV